MQISAISLGLTRPAPSGLEALVRAIYPDVWYDPSDTATLFQDAAGTTPVTAVEQPVGLMLDKSKGLVLGSELVTNGDFATDTWWSKDTGVTITGGQCVFTAVTTNRGVYRSVLTTAGKYYGVTYTITVNSGAIRVLASGASGVSRTASGTYTELIGGASGTLFGLFANPAFDGTIDNISVRELPGNHAYHTPGDTTTRPTYSRRINLLTKTEQFDDAAWTKYAATISANTVVAPDGTLTADTLVEDATTDAHYLSRSLTVTSGASYTFSVFAKASGRVFLRLIGGTNFPGTVNFNLSDGTYTVAAGSPTVSCIAVGNGWYRCQITSTTAAASITPSISMAQTSTGTGAYQGDGTSGIYIWGASLVPADLAALPYQRVNTATDYDASSVYPSYLRCDGTNDGMQTNAIDFSGTDKMFVSAGVRKLSDAAQAIFVELSADTGSNNGVFRMTFPGGAGAANYGWLSKGTLTGGSTGAPGYAAPITNVTTGIGDISGDSAILRVNSTQGASSSADQGTGNYGNHKLYLFARGGTGLPFNGWFYGLQIKGATLTAAQIAIVERYNASKTKTVSIA